MAISTTPLRSTLILCLLVASCGGGDDDKREGTDDDGSTGGGASGGNDTQTNPPDGLASCAALGSHLEKVCDQDAGFESELCEDDRLTYEPIGCGAEYAEFVRCYSESDIPDCDDGTATGCPDPSIYLRCQSGFAARTACSRLPSLDAECEMDKFAYTCLSDLPSGCTSLPSEGSAAQFACCKSFAKAGARHFVD